MKLRFLHFNDVYHISDAELVAKFGTVFEDPSLVNDVHAGSHNAREIFNGHTFRLFSGDAFSPSLEASVLRGDHMVPLLEALKIDMACYGNHDFDFGEERLKELSRKTSFPWLLSNAFHKSPHGKKASATTLLACADNYVVREVDGFRIGFIGLAGQDWISNCERLPECTIEVPYKIATVLEHHLRNEEKCDLVVALTHMRLADDTDLIRYANVDFAFGGHDHYIIRRDGSVYNTDPSVPEPGHEHERSTVTESANNVRLVKSGTDWKGISVLEIHLEREANGSASVRNYSLQQIEDIRSLPNYDTIPQSPKILCILDNVQKQVAHAVKEPLLYTHTPLDGRTNIIRRQETNLGNMLADAVRAYYASDIAFVNSGAVRCDRVIDASAAPLTVRDIREICPFGNAFVVLKVPGDRLLEALENSVSDAHTDGRFLQMSGLSITVDWCQPEGSRVSSVQLHPTGSTVSPVTVESNFSIAMANFIASGFDGYSQFHDLVRLHGGTDGGIVDTELFLEVFRPVTTTEEESADWQMSAIKRARETIISGYAEDGLPIVGPVLDNRIVEKHAPPSGK